MRGLPSVTTASSKSRRRARWRFSLRTLFAAVAVTGLLLAVYVWYVRVSSHEYLINHGWRFEPMAGGWKASNHSLLNLPDEQMRMLAADNSILALEFSARVRPQHARVLGTMTQLQSLSITGSPGSRFTQAHFDAISRLSRLQSLTLSIEGVNAEGLAKLSRLKRLRELRLYSDPVEAGEFAAIARLSSLENLEVSCDRLTAAELAHLVALPRLRRLCIYYPPIDAQMFAAFGRMKSLRELDISGVEAGYDEAGIDALRRARPDLRVITWPGCIVPAAPD